jgi:hypothetical protein
MLSWNSRNSSQVEGESKKYWEGKNEKLSLLFCVIIGVCCGRGRERGSPRSKNPFPSLDIIMTSILSFREGVIEIEDRGNSSVFPRKRGQEQNGAFQETTVVVIERSRERGNSCWVGFSLFLSLSLKKIYKYKERISLALSIREKEVSSASRILLLFCRKCVLFVLQSIRYDGIQARKLCLQSRRGIYFESRDERRHASSLWSEER